MKIRIFGCSGSGKSYLAERIQKDFKIKHYDLDEIYWDTQAYPYQRRNDIDREMMLNNITMQKDWCIEGAYTNFAVETFSKADYIIIIQKSKARCKLKVVIRYLKKKIGLEKGLKESLKDVKDMFGLINRFENNTDFVLKYLDENNLSYHIVKNYKDFKKVVKNNSDLT